MSTDSYHFGNQASANAAAAWYVYLLPLYDESAFKVGFTRAPLQRIHSFTHRYFERFDLYRSQLLQVPSCTRARSIEASIKKMLSEYRAEAPRWVLDGAGGDTEWFIGAEFERAQRRMAAESGDQREAFAFLQDELRRFSSMFELWAIEQAKQLENDRVAVALGHNPSVSATTLNDWLDAYRHFGIELFVDDAAAVEFVKSRSRLSTR